MLELGFLYLSGMVVFRYLTIGVNVSTWRYYLGMFLWPVIGMYLLVVIVTHFVKRWFGEHN